MKIHSAALRAVGTMFDGTHLAVLPNMPLRISKVEVDREVAEDIGQIITAEYAELVEAADAMLDRYGIYSHGEVKALADALAKVKGA